ncbi:hypothetical protein BDP55DRAFT_565907, partial [Colletotrichum godetiae]
ETNAYSSYLTNIDCWSILALVKTAPVSQARLLGDFFHKHLCSRTSIGVAFTVRSSYFRLQTSSCVLTSPPCLPLHSKYLIDSLEKTMMGSRDILQDLLSDLHGLVKIGASFMSTEVNSFLNNDGQPGQAAECYPYLTEIRGRFNELGQLIFRLGKYQGRCSFFIRHCESSRRSLRNDQPLAVRPRDGDEVRVLAFSTFLTQAFPQTTALFSADGIIAFTRNWQSFLLSLLVAYGINITIVAALIVWLQRAGRRVQNALDAGPGLPVVQPTQNSSDSSAVALRPTGEAVAQGFATDTSSTNSNGGGLTFHFRRRLSDRFWLTYRQPERADDAELGNRNTPIVEELA